MAVDARVPAQPGNPRAAPGAGLPGYPAVMRQCDRNVRRFGYRPVTPRGLGSRMAATTSEEPEQVLAGGPVTIATIAELAGVSVPTVSKVVNGRAQVAPETRERVEAVIRRHGFRRQKRPAMPSSHVKASLPRAGGRLRDGNDPRCRAGRRQARDGRGRCRSSTSRQGPRAVAGSRRCWHAARPGW